MRKTIAILVATLVICISGCSSPEEGPASPADAAVLRGAPAVVQAQLRDAALRFVEAYRTTVIGGDELRSLAGTPLMRRFAYWIGVTNRAFPGQISATSTVGAVSSARSVGGDVPVFETDLSAQIDVVAQPSDGEPFEMSVPLDGPVRFTAGEDGGWRVVDFVRFGVPVSGAFVPLDLDYRRPGVRITVDSFGGIPSWSFFVRISATGPQVLTLDDLAREGDVLATFIWFAVLFTLSGQLNEMGFMAYLGAALGGTLHGLAPFPAFVAILAAYILLHYIFVSQTAHLLALFGVFLDVGVKAGVPAAPLAYQLLFATNYFSAIAPQGSSANLLFAGSGLLSQRDLYKVGGLSTAFCAAIYLVIGTAWLWLVIRW